MNAYKKPVKPKMKLAKRHDKRELCDFPKCHRLKIPTSWKGRRWYRKWCQYHHAGKGYYERINLSSLESKKLRK